MKRSLLLSLALLLLLVPCAAFAEEEDVSFAEVLVDMYHAAEHPSAQTGSRLEKDRAAVKDPVALAVAERWEQLYVDPGYTLRIFGRDDPGDIPVRGKHAFVVLGYALHDGEMTDELKGRCDAAAAAAQAFPESLLVCTGGATASGNPSATEADRMANWLRKHGVDSGRILVETRSMTTGQNAVNTVLLLTTKYPRVTNIVIVTSDYHMAGSVQGFRSQVLRAGGAITVTAGPAWPTPKGQNASPAQDAP